MCTFYPIVERKIKLLFQISEIILSASVTGGCCFSLYCLSYTRFYVVLEGCSPPF